MAKCCIYSRVSSAGQDIENQLTVLKSWAKQRGFEVVGIYQEQESAWKAGHQKELKRLLDDIRKKRPKIDFVLVWALDRLSREGIARIFELVNTFKQYDVRILSYQEPWTEAPGAIGDILYALTAWVAEYESKRRSERTLAGLERAKSQGKKLGRPKGAGDKRKRRKSGYFRRHAK